MLTDFGNVVHVVGTGTIGEPLIGLLADYKEKFGIDEVTFSKKTPLKTDRSKVRALQERGAKLCVEGEKYSEFKELEMTPAYEFEEAIARAGGVIDCTPDGSGIKNKKNFYKKYEDNGAVFLAQGSEHGFGKMYAYGINDSKLEPSDKYVQIASCNTHNIAALVKTFAMESNNGIEDCQLDYGRFLCLRRSSDMSEDKGVVPSPHVEKHDDKEIHPYGTHQAQDAVNLFDTMGYDLNLFSSAMKLSTQYMHSIWFDLKLKNKITEKDVESKIKANPLVAVTQKQKASQVFSFGRNHGPYGRILNQTVIVLPSLYLKNCSELIGCSFTPQDGNSLLSSIAVILYHFYPTTYKERIKCLDRYLFKEI